MFRSPITFVVLSILVAGCSISSNSKMTPEEFMRGQPIAWAATSIEQCDEMKSPLDQECLMTIAKNENDIELCERVSVEPYEGIFAELSPSRDKCIYKVAENSKNVELCAKIESPVNIANCLMILPLAQIDGFMDRTPLDQRTQFAAFCEKIQPRNDAEVTQKAMCFGNAAEYALDSLLCEKSIIPNDPIFNGSTCFRGVAVSLNRSDLCDKIAFDAARQDCKNTVAIRLSKGLGPQPMETGVSSSSAVSRTQTTSVSSSELSQGTSFSSAYFTLSFVLPVGFDVRDTQNSIGIAKAPFVDREIGDSNAFFNLTRYNQYNTFETETARYRKLLKNPVESTMLIDGESFLTISGEDWGRFGGDSAGKVFVVFFPRSRLEIMTRPANSNQNFDPVKTGKSILGTMRFSK